MTTRTKEELENELSQWNKQLEIDNWALKTLHGPECGRCNGIWIGCHHYENIDYCNRQIGKLKLELQDNSEQSKSCEICDYVY